jgi:hypothetical protein
MESPSEVGYKKSMTLPVLLGDDGILDIGPLDKPPALSVAIGPQEDIIPRHLALPHLSRLVVKSPVFQSVATLPFHLVIGILVLVPELHGNAVVGEGKQFLSQTVRLFLLPFLGQELFDLVGAFDELVPVPPDCVWGVC